LDLNALGIPVDWKSEPPEIDHSLMKLIKIDYDRFGISEKGISVDIDLFNNKEIVQTEPGRKGERESPMAMVREKQLKNANCRRFIR
jgi:hypothetical protein